MSQMIASLKGDTKPLALSSSSFLNNWKGQRKRTLIGIRKEYWYSKFGGGGEDVLHKMEPESLKSLLKKDYKLVCARKYPICINCPPFLTFVYPLQNKLIIK